MVLLGLGLWGWGLELGFWGWFLVEGVFGPAVWGLMGFLGLELFI